MTIAFNIIVGLLSLLLFALLFDRFRRIAWDTTKWAYMCMYLFKMLWALGVMYSASAVEALWYQPLGLVGILGWIYVTRHAWTRGCVPKQVLSAAGEFDDLPHATPPEQHQHRRSSDPTRVVDMELEL